jgi:hypothetical protein
MAGTWLMEFTRNSGAAKSNVEHYTITLNPVDNSRCGSASPCYVGHWFNLDVKNEEAPDFTVTMFLSGDVIELSGTEVDSVNKGPQHYSAKAPNDNRIKTITFTGPWSQSSPSDGNQAATFTLTHE